ncbi:UNVERIFIED_CONTAM: putative bifunctional methylthioribulose-1-phosphate dehydratase/enolase-phosphatase E1 1, partial [Sesamum latifolium]
MRRLLVTKFKAAHEAFVWRGAVVIEHRSRSRCVRNVVLGKLVLLTPHIRVWGVWCYLSETFHFTIYSEIKAYPKTTAVLVRNHGIYIWGDSWISAKTQAECYHYLFDAAIKLHQLGLDWSTPSHGPIQIPNGVPGNHHYTKDSAKAGTLSNGIEPSRRCIVLDIEGTTTPISFVSDVLFPYARDSVGKHLELTYDTAETQYDIKLLRVQVQEDLENGVVGAIPIPSNGEKQEIIAALVANIEAMIKADRKITSLKQLQGHIWRTGFQRKELEGVVFDDVPAALEKWHALGVKTPFTRPCLHVPMLQRSLRFTSGRKQ